MDRRHFLTMTSLLAVGSTAGCAGMLGSDRYLGESVTHRGVEVTPDKYRTTSEVTYNWDFMTKTRSAPDGATFLLTHLTVTHVGESKRAFPRRGFTAPKQTIETYYTGQELITGKWESSAAAISVDGAQLPCYPAVLEEKTEGSPVRDVTVEGWIISVIPDEFLPADTEIRITWGGADYSPQTDSSNLETVTWRYSEDARVSAANRMNSTHRR